MKITALTNGPLLVEGLTELVDQQGVSSPLPGTPNVALCRCGSSAKKPFCDGTHLKAGFRSGAVVVEASKPRPSLSTWESEGGSSAPPAVVSASNARPGEPR
jgi:CDGSH-type Zn-finger protein